MSERKLPRPGNWHLPGNAWLSPIPQGQLVVARPLLKVVRHKAGVDYDLNFPLLLPRLGGMVPPDLMFIAQLLMKGHIECADKERRILRSVWRLGCASTNGLTTHTWRANRASAKTRFARWPTKSQRSGATAYACCCRLPTIYCVPQVSTVSRPAKTLD